MSASPVHLGGRGRPRAWTNVCAAFVCLALAAGCKSKAPAGTDAALTQTVQGVLAADNAIAGQQVVVTVQSSVVTLTGSVQNEAQRILAARDAAGVAGVAKVIDTIGVNPGLPAVAAATPLPSAATGEQGPTPAPANNQPPHQPAPIERPQQAGNNNSPPPQPESPPAPTFKNVTIAVGDTIPVRVTQTLDSATTQPDTTFSGVVASNIVVSGLVAIPAGTNVSGRVDAVKDAAHFKGSSLLTVSLTAVNRRGEHITVRTEPYTIEGKGRGSNTAEKTGGGAAVGAILGGIFGGGKGAAIGAAAGAGAGAGSNAITRGQQVQIASESVVRFHLSAPITLKVRTDAPDRQPDTQPGDPSLQPR